MLPPGSPSPKRSTWAIKEATCSGAAAIAAMVMSTYNPLADQGSSTNLVTGTAPAITDPGWRLDPWLLDMNVSKDIRPQLKIGRKKLTQWQLHQLECRPWIFLFAGSVFTVSLLILQASHQTSRNRRFQEPVMYTWVVLGVFVCLLLQAVMGMHFVRSVSKILPGTLLLGHLTMFCIQNRAIVGDAEVAAGIL